MPTLTIRRADSSGPDRVMRVDRKAVLIGRSSRCGLQLKDPAVSRLHAAIIPQPDGGWMIARQRSAQPVLVDGASIDKALLRGGETIRIGDFKIVFRVQDGSRALEEEETVRLHPAVVTVAAQPTAALIFQAGGLRSGRVSLDRACLVFGRGEECDVVLDDQRCSRKHAEVQRIGAGFMLRDLGSTNGVLVNGQRTGAAVELRDGDVIQMGGTAMRFTLGPAAETEPDSPTVAAAAAAELAGMPASSAGLLGRLSGSKPIFQVGSAFAAAVLLAATAYITTGSSRRQPREPRPVAMQPPGRDSVRSGEAPPSVQTVTEEHASDPVVSPEEEEVDDSESPAPAPRAVAPRVESARPGEDESEEDEAVQKSADDSGTNRESPRFADLLDNDEGKPRKADRPRVSSTPSEPPEDSEQITSEQAPAARLPIPDAAEVEEASQNIRKVFAEELSGPDEVAPTLAKLLKAARQSAKPASKFALLLAAERKAVQASAFRRACEVIDARAEMFEIDALQSRLNMLRDASKATGEPKDEIFDIVVAVTEEAVDAERFDVAAKSAALAGTVATAIEQQSPAKSPGKRVDKARQLKNSVAETKKLHQKYEQARETLRETPDDAKALEVVGKYLCFVKDAWRDGLRALAAGRETALQDLAARELALAADGEADTTVFFSLAGDWWDFAENTKRVGDLPAGTGDLVKSHAAKIYERIVSGLEDPIDAELAKKRIVAAGLSE